MGKENENDIDAKQAALELLMEYFMDRTAADCVVTREGFKEDLTTLIENMTSQVGEEHHKRLKAAGVIDKTGMTWEEQDAVTRKEIERHRAALEWISDEKNWTL